MTLGAVDIANALGGRLIGDADTLVRSVVTDSRALAADCLFVALHGERFDGHDFLPVAFEGGASCVLSEMEYNPEKGAVIVVDDTRVALLALAEWYRSFLPARIVAVTGSVGKTTTKELCSRVMDRKYRTHKTTGNFNNTIGLPMTLLSADSSHEVLVLEMGMNSFGEIEALSKTAGPDIAIITNIGTSHIQNLGSREGIKKAKLEILAGMNSGHIILNADEPLLWEESGRTGQREHFFGINNQKADIKAQDIELGAEETLFTITYPGGSERVRLNTPGIHNVYNALAAFTAGLICSVPPHLAALGLESYIPSANRQNICVFKEYTFIEDCYNASPESMDAALSVLKRLPAHRRILVLSDMLELGEYAVQAHHSLGANLVRCGADRLFLYGPLSEHIQEGALESGMTADSVTYAEKAVLPRLIADELKKGDAVLFKASHGMKMDELIKALRELL